MQSIATKDNPIRSSLLPNLFHCPTLFYDKWLTDGDESAGEPAETGSLVHEGIAVWHKTTNRAKAQEAMHNAKAEKFKLGDLSEAIRLFDKYIFRLTNSPYGKIKHIEKEVKFEWPCSKIDPTKENLWITGTIDLVTDLGYKHFVIDHKAGHKEAKNMVLEYPAQMAGYVMGAKLDLKVKGPIEALIARTRDLLRSDLKFYHETKVDIDVAAHILDNVANKIAIIRMGMLEQNPGKYCEVYCKLAYFPGCINRTKRVVPVKEPATRKPLKQIGNVADLFKPVGGK